MAAVSRLTRQLSDERASILAREAIALSQSGETEKASRKLREAAALGHDNSDVHEAFMSLHRDQNSSPLLADCRRYALYHNEKAGQEVINYLKAQGHSVTSAQAVECLQILLETKPASLSSSQDVILAELARQSKDVQLYIASQMLLSTTEFFDNLYDRGDQSANFLRTIVLDSLLWTSEELRLQVEDDLFQLFLAKLMESGHDLDGRALRGIALLLMADAPRLQAFVDDDGFEAILSSLHIQLPADVRGQATVVFSKLLETSEDTAHKAFTRYVRSHVAKKKSDDLVLAFSAAASIFPVAPALTAPLFLTEGFLSSLMPLLLRNASGAIVVDAFLTLINSACIDDACRKSISQHCAIWLADRVSNGSEKQSAIAATVLAKLRTVTAAQDPKLRGGDAPHPDDNNVDELVILMKRSLHAADQNTTPEAIEGLAYSSLKPHVKEDLAGDQDFLKNLIRVLDMNMNKPGVVIGGLSILSNLTQYRPNLSEEQKKMSQLKAYANATKQPDSNVLDNDSHVSVRCTRLVQAGVVPVLSKLGKSGSLAVKQLVAKILLSLSRNAKDRGMIAQQGAVKVLIALQQTTSQDNDKQTALQFDSAHALARILISLNPSHVFAAGTTPHLTSAIPPLAALLKPESGPALSDQPRDLLPIFESLLALTNLASSPDPAAVNSIIRIAWDDVEGLLLSNNVMIRRAACELTCNLAAYPSGAARFADGTRRAGQRLHMLLALADVEDMATRRAAGGALAMLTDEAAAISSILDIPRGAEILLGLCHDDDEDVVQRGLVCVKNVISAEGEMGERGKRAMREAEAKRSSIPQSVI
jgi:protein unc-45